MTDDIRASRAGSPAASVEASSAVDRPAAPAGQGGDVADTLMALEALDARARTVGVEAGPAAAPPAEGHRAIEHRGGGIGADAPVVSLGDRPVPRRDKGGAEAAPPEPDSAAARPADAGDGAAAAGAQSLVVWEPPAAADEPPAETSTSFARPFAFAAVVAAIALLGGIGLNAIRGSGGSPPATGVTAAGPEAGAAPPVAVASAPAEDDLRARIDRLAADVAALQARVTGLDGSAQRAASAADMALVRGRLAALDDGLAQLRQSTAGAPGGVAASGTDAVAQLAERVGRLEKQTPTAPAKPMAAAPTGAKPGAAPVKDTIANAAVVPPPAPKPPARPVEVARAAPETRAAAEPPRGMAELRPPAEIPDPRTRPARGWVLRDLYDGAALIQGRDGMIEVTPGQRVAGLGRIERIERRGAGWVVVTERGYIPSLGY